jgi:hypothetical protein
MGVLIGPSWFLGTEIIFDAVMMIIAGIITTTGFLAYRFFRDERHQLHTTGFLLITGSYLVIFLSHLMLWLELRELDHSMRELVHVYNLLTVGALLHAVLFLLGLTILVIVYLQINDRLTRTLLCILLLFGVLLSNQVRSAFYLLLVALLVFIVIKLWHNYVSKRSKAALLVLLGFFGLLIGEALLSIMFVSPALYVIAGLVTQISYLLILASLVVR